MEVLGYFAAIFIGISLGMLGGGGSILTVPVLVYFFGIAPFAATTYSLFIVGISSLAGSISYFRKDLINFRVFILFGLPSVATIFFTRRYLLTSIPSQCTIGNYDLNRNTFLMIAFAGLMLFASLSMLKKKNNHTDESGKDTPPFRWKLLLLSGIGVGLISGILGAGCGFLIVPALVLCVRLPMKIAIGTSLAIIALNSLTGFSFSPDYSLIDWTLFTTISMIAVAGIFIGTKIAVRQSDRMLRKGFAILILCVALLILSRECMLL